MEKIQLLVFEFRDSFNNLSKGSVIHDKQFSAALIRKYHLHTDF